MVPYLIFPQTNAGCQQHDHSTGAIWLQPILLPWKVLWSRFCDHQLQVEVPISSSFKFSVFFSGNQLFRMEKLAISARSHFINHLGATHAPEISCSWKCVWQQSKSSWRIALNIHAAPLRRWALLRSSTEVNPKVSASAIASSQSQKRGVVSIHHLQGTLLSLGSSAATRTPIWCVPWTNKGHPFWPCWCKPPNLLACPKHTRTLALECQEGHH